MLGNHILRNQLRNIPVSEDLSSESEEERHIGFLISDVARMMRTAFDRRVRALGLTRSQWLVTNRLHRRPGATQSELAEMLEVEKATAGRMVDRMEKKGWVVRRGDAGDRRGNRLHLTREALLIQGRLAQIADRTIDDALALLSSGDRRVTRLPLTREALLIQVRLAQIAARTIDDALALLSPGERDQFSEWMRREKTQLQAMLKPDSAEPLAPAEEFTGELVP